MAPNRFLLLVGAEVRDWMGGRPSGQNQESELALSLAQRLNHVAQRG